MGTVTDATGQGWYCGGCSGTRGQSRARDGGRQRHRRVTSWVGGREGLGFWLILQMCRGQCCWVDLFSLDVPSLDKVFKKRS